MPEITLQLDEALGERLRAVAKASGCSTEALILQLLQELLPPDAAATEPDAIGAVATHWNKEETAFLQDIAQAFDGIPAGEAAAADARATEWDKPLR